MIECEIHYKTNEIMGPKKGQRVYYAHPKALQKMSNEALIDRIVRETSLSAGDVSNALISLGNIVCEALHEGMSVDLAEMGSLRLMLPARMMDSPEEVTAKTALHRPKIIFTPKNVMRKAAETVEISVDHSRVVEALPDRKWARRKAAARQDS